MAIESVERESRDKSLFDRIAGSYSRKDTLPGQVRARELRLRQTVRAVEGYDNGRILEVGCGAGYSARYLDGMYEEYVGIDYSAELIEVAKLQNHGEGRSFFVSNAKTFASDEPFDMIFMIGVLHHIDDPVQALRNLMSQVRPGGWVVANEPQSSNPLIRAARRLRKNVDENYSDEQEQYSPDELRSIMVSSGLNDVRLVPQGLLSTPFAEVTLPRVISSPMSMLACFLDPVVERAMPSVSMALSWNLVGIGRRAE